MSICKVDSLYFVFELNRLSRFSQDTREFGFVKELHFRGDQERKHILLDIHYIMMTTEKKTKIIDTVR